MAEEQNPTFYLLGSNPKKVSRDLEEGLYNNFFLKYIHNESGKITPLKPVCNGGPQNPSYSFRGKNGDEIVVVTTNCDVHVKTSLCEWCRLNTESEPIFLMRKYPSRGVDIYAYDRKFCDYRCAYAFALDSEKTRARVQYLEAKYRMLTEYAASKNGAEPLLPAPSYRLLEEHGGSMTRAQYRDARYVYHKMNTVPVLDENTGEYIFRELYMRSKV